MDLLLVLFHFIITIIFGLIILKILKFSQNNQIETIAVSYGLGIGLISIILFLISFLDIKWDRTIFTIGIFIFLFFFKVNFLGRYSFNFKFNLIEKILATLILLLFIFVIFEGQIRPLYAWDGWATWLFISKIFYISEGVNNFYFRYLGTDYPFIISNYISFLYTQLGHINDKAVLLVFSFYYMATGFFFYSAVKIKLGITKALIFTFLLLSTSELIRHGGRFEAGHVDLPLAFYFFVGIILLVRYYIKGYLRTLFLLQFIVVIMSLVKNEGIPFALFIEIMVLKQIISKKLLKHFYSLFIFIIPLVIWSLYKFQNGVFVNNYFNETSFHFDRTEIIFISVFNEFLNIGRWNFIWISFIISVFLYLIYRRSKEASIVLSALLFQLTVYLFIFFLTPVSISEHIKIIDRLLIHLTPLSLYFVAITYYNSKKYDEKI